MDEDTRHKLDSVFYDKFVAKYYKNVAQQPPSKDVWLRSDVELKQKYVQSFKPNPLVNWVSYEEKAEGKVPPELTSSERAKYYSAKILDSTLKYVDTVLNSTTREAGSVASFLYHAWDDPNYDKNVLHVDSKDKLAKFDKTIQAISKLPQQAVTGSLHERLNKYFESVEPQVQHDLRTKIFAAAAGSLPSLILFKGVGEGLKPFIGELEAGKITGGSLLEKAGGLTKVLQSTVVGRTAYRMMEGSLQGFFVDAAQDDDLHKAIQDAPSWGLFNIALPIVGRIIGSPFKASMKLYSELATHTGAEFVINSIADTAQRLDKNIQEPIKDELIAKLDKANSKTLNKIAREKFKKLYYFLTPEQKKTVTAEVRGILNESFNNPAAHAGTATVIETNKAVQQQAVSDPVFAKQAARMSAVTKKVTGSPVLTGPAKEAKKQAETVQKIVPGAASSQSPEFLNNLLAQYEANIGFENPKHKLLAMWANKDQYPPQTAKRIQEEMDEMYKGLSHKQIMARLKFLQKHIAKLDATWEINPQGDKRRVFRSTGLTPQSKTEFQKELDDLYDSTFGEK